MKKIGTTSSGTVIVEMTAAQCNALSQTQGVSAAQPVVDKMSIAEKVEYVRERIPKLNPKKKEGVARSISAMFQFTGGISEAAGEEIISRLQREKFFAIDEIGRVTYKKGLTSGLEWTRDGASCLHFNRAGPAPLRPVVKSERL